MDEKMPTWLLTLTWHSLERHMAYFQYTPEPYFSRCPTSNAWMFKVIFDVFGTSQATQNFGHPCTFGDITQDITIQNSAISKNTVFL